MIRKLLTWPYRRIEELLDRRVPATGLALFRIAYSCVLFGEILQIYYYRRLIFDPIPYLQQLDDFSALLRLWMVVALCLAAGFWTRTAAILNYLLTLFFISGFREFEYHYDYVMIGGNFLLLWIPVEAALSLDRLIAVRRTGQKAPRRVSVLCYYAPLVLGVGVVYLDSVFHKVTSPMWLAGLGLWLPASLPQVTWLDLTPILDLEGVVRFLGYLTVVFEAAFLFLFFRRRFRLPLLAVGLGLHLGICLSFPIPLFGLGVVSFYLLLVPFRFWKKLFPDSEAPAAAAPSLPFLAPPVAKRVRVSAVLGFVLTAFFLQATATYRAPFFASLWPRLDAVAAGRAWHSAVRAVGPLARKALGISPHNVFMDFHFEGYEHIVALVCRDGDGRETWLPLVDRDGHPAFPAWGRIWVQWTFRANGPQVRRFALAHGIRRITAFWALSRGLDLDSLEFEILVKKIEAPRGWRRNFLREQIAKPWTTAGTARWRDGECEITLGDLEAL